MKKLKKLIEFLNRDVHPLALGVVALVVVGVATFMVGVAESAFHDNALQGAVMAVLAASALGIAIVLLIAIVNPRANAGGWGALVVFTLGSILTLFNSFTDLIGGEFAELSTWQAVAWGLGVLIGTGLMVVQAIRK